MNAHFTMREVIILLQNTYNFFNDIIRFAYESCANDFYKGKQKYFYY